MHFFVLALVFSIGCKSSQKSSAKEIIGQDRRTPVTDQNLLASVGELSTAKGVCTAFLVDKATIITAAHCLQMGDANMLQQPEAVKFAPFSDKPKVFVGLFADQNYASAVVFYDQTKDVAKLKVAKEFSSFLSVAPWHEGSAAVVSYDTEGSVLMTDTGCSVSIQMEKDTGALLHDCGTLPGSSGSPIMQEGNAVGVHLGYVKSINQNIAFDLSDIDDVSKNLLNFKSSKVVSNETHCGQDCGASCEVCVNVTCVKKGGYFGNTVGTCQSCTTDPACEARCTLERQMDCAIHKNVCDVYPAVLPGIFQQITGAVEYLYSPMAVVHSKSHCRDIVEASDFAKTVGMLTYAGVAFDYGNAVNAFKAAVSQTLSVAEIESAAGVAMDEHIAMCACNRAHIPD